MSSQLKHFQDVTQVRNAAEYINQLDRNSLIIYSPTSLAHINLVNSKVHMIDSRIFGRSVVFIDALLQIVKDSQEGERR